MTVFGAIVFLGSFVLWAALLGNLFTSSASDPAGRGLAEAYAFFTVIGLWVLLGALLIIAGVRGQMPSSAKVAAILLFPLSAAATIAALTLLQHPASGAEPWPVLIPALIPPVIMAYALWALLPSFRSAVSSGLAGTLAGGAILALSLAPWPRVLSGSSARAATRTRQVQAETRGQQTAFDSLSVDSSLADWRPFVEDGNPFRDRALETIRRSPRRQADAEAMIADGYAFPMRDLPHLNLEPTSALCSGAGGFLAHEAEFFRTNNATPTPFGVAGARMQRYLPAMEWLRAERCDIGAALAAIESALREFPEPASAEYTRFLAAVTRLRTSL